MHSPRVKKRLIGHEQSAGAFLSRCNRRCEMCINTFSIDCQLGQFFLHCLLLVETGLANIQQRGTDHEICHAETSLNKSESAVSMKRGANVDSRFSMTVKKDVLPGNQHIVKHHQCIHFIKAITQRVILDRPTTSEPGAADHSNAWRS